MLMSARIYGRREHKPRRAGEPKRTGPGEIVAEAVWPAVISPADSDRLRALLSDSQRIARQPGSIAPLVGGARVTAAGGKILRTFGMAMAAGEETG